MKKFVAVVSLVVSVASRGETRVFESGTHYLTETKIFTAADSGTVWKAAPGAKPVISGARKVTGWRKAENGLWCADVPWVTGRANGFRQLTVDGALRPRAKHPNTDYFTSLEFPPPEGIGWAEWWYSHPRSRFRINSGEVDPKWNLAKGEVIFYHLWNDSHCPAASVSVEKGTNWFNLASPVSRNPCGCPWRIENLREIADMPGEWVLDYDEKRVYYRPLAGEDPSKTEIAVPFVDTLVRIDGAESVRFEGLAFADTRYELARDDRNDFQASCGVTAAVVLTNAVGCSFDRCSFTRLSGYALDFQAGTRGTKVSGCRMTALGAGGVKLNGPAPSSASPDGPKGARIFTLADPRLAVRDNEISDCEIGDFGRDFPSAVGVLAMNAEGTKVLHNDIHDGYYTGVSVGWNWGYLPSVARDNEIVWNRIWNIGKGLLSDMGAIYLLGVAPGTKVHHNVIHGVDARFYGGWGIYLDEGSAGVLVENNLVYDTKYACYQQHYGRNNTVRNNIFAGGKLEQICRGRRERHFSFFFYNNIVYWRDGELHAGDWVDEEPYEFIQGSQTGRPDILVNLKQSLLCDYNLYFNPKTPLKDVKWDKKDCTWTDWRGKRGQDRHSAWGDPLFVDAAKHDYRLRPDSPALKLGFRPFDVSGAGCRKSAGREAVVFVEAHPDDLPGHLGTALRLAEKFDVHVVDFTHGELGCGVEKFKSGWTKRTRTAEETEVCRRAGFTLHWCDAVDGYSHADEKVCRQLVDVLTNVRPRAVFCHWPVDVHADHVMSAAATMKAVQLSGLSPELYFHEQDIQSRGFRTSYYVDITPYAARKAELAKLYVCQGGEKIAERKAESNRVYGRNSSQENVELIGTFPGCVKPGRSVFDGLPGVTQ